MTARFNTEAALYCHAATTPQFGTSPLDLSGRSTVLQPGDSAIWNPGTLCSDTASLLFDNSQFHTAALDWVPTNTQHWTVSFWIAIENFNSVSTSTDDFLPLWYMPTGIASPNPGYDYFTGVGFEKDTNELVVRIADVTHTRISGGAFLAAPGAYDWKHITVTCNNLNGVVTVYLNGLAVNSGAVAGVSYVAGTQSYIGGVQASPGTGPALTIANHFSGHIGEARFFDYPLNGSEVAALSANRDYSPLQTAISPESPQQTRFLTGDTTTNETQRLEFTSGSTPTFNLGCDAALPASYTVADMQIAVDSLYPSIRRTPELGYVGTTSQASTFNSVQDTEYLLEYEPTSALPAEFTLISDFTGPIDVRLSYRNTDTQLLSSTYAPVARSHVFFTMVNAQVTPQISATYSTSVLPASAVSVSCSGDNSKIVAFALRPSSETSSNATLLADYDSYGTIIPNGAVTSQRIDAYASTRHKNLGPNLVPGESLAESLPAVGVWVALSFLPSSLAGVAVGGSDLDYSFIFQAANTQPFIPFYVDAGTTYVAPTFIPLVQDPDSPFLRERPFANNSSDSSPGALPLLNAAGQLDLSLFENVPQTISALASEAISAGQPVNIYDNGGVTEVRRADSTLDQPASGFVLANFAPGATADVYLDGINDAATLLGLGIATTYYLGAAGNYVAVRPTASGSFIQRLGRTTSADVIVWEADEYPVYLP